MDQAPGFYRHRIGSVVVTALNDGGGDLPFAALLGIIPEDAQTLLAQSFRPPVGRTTVNTFLVQAAGRTVLIDTGAGASFGPTAGKLPANLAAAGVAPGDIDLVLLTHLHGDHTGGLVHNGTAVFPNAAVGVAEAEFAYWLDDANAAKVPEARRGGFATAKAALAPYMGRLHTLTSAPAAPGITPVPLPGHTPGHTGFRIKDGDAALLIWGDVIHLQDIQGPRPEIGLAFDIDMQKATETRQHTLDMAASERLLVAGMHLSFPAFHHVARAGSGYRLEPVMWAPTP